MSSAGDSCFMREKGIATNVLVIAQVMTSRVARAAAGQQDAAVALLGARLRFLATKLALSVAVVVGLSAILRCEMTP